MTTTPFFFGNLKPVPCFTGALGDELAGVIVLFGFIDGDVNGGHYIYPFLTV